MNRIHIPFPVSNFLNILHFAVYFDISGLRWNLALLLLEKILHHTPWEYMRRDPKLKRSMRRTCANQSISTINSVRLQRVVLSCSGHSYSIKILLPKGFVLLVWLYDSFVHVSDPINKLETSVREINKMSEWVWTAFHGTCNCPYEIVHTREKRPQLSNTVITPNYPR